MKNKSAKDFDTAYDRMQVPALEDAVNLFEQYSKDGDNPDLKAWVAKTLPHLKEHLDMAKRLSLVPRYVHGAIGAPAIRAEPLTLSSPRLPVCLPSSVGGNCKQKERAFMDAQVTRWIPAQACARNPLGRQELLV